MSLIPLKFWQNVNKARRVLPLRSKFILPAFTFQSLGDKTSLFLSSPSGCQSCVGSLTNDFTQAFTIDFWIKPLSLDSCFFLTYGDPNTDADHIFQFQASFGTIGAIVKTAAPSAGGLATDLVMGLGEWNHVALTADGSEIRLYLNGVLEDSAALAGPYASPGNEHLIIGDAQPRDIRGIIIDHVRMWDNVINETYLNIYKDKRVAYDKYIISDNELANLKAYLNFDEGAGITTESLVDNEVYNLDNNANDPWILDDGFPEKYGGSFVVAEYDVVLEEKTSLKLPIRKPAGANWCPIVRWLDEEGNNVRRKLWTVGETTHEIAIYSGETLPASFTLEIWNIDGELTVHNPTALDFILAKRNVVSYVTDTTNPSDASPSADYQLATAFPLSFPLLFNTQQNPNDYGSSI